MLLVIVSSAFMASACSSEPDTHHIDSETADALGWAWPLTVDEGDISCPGAGRLVFTADGTDYALNGLAKSENKYADIDPIWKADPDTEGLKIGIGDLIAYGNTACGYPS